MKTRGMNRVMASFTFAKHITRRIGDPLLGRIALRNASATASAERSLPSSGTRQPPLEVIQGSEDSDTSTISIQPPSITVEQPSVVTVARIDEVELISAGGDDEEALLERPSGTLVVPSTRVQLLLPERESIDDAVVSEPSEAKALPLRLPSFKSDEPALLRLTKHDYGDDADDDEEEDEDDEEGLPSIVEYSSPLRLLPGRSLWGLREDSEAAQRAKTIAEVRRAVERNFWIPTRLFLACSLGLVEPLALTALITSALLRLNIFTLGYMGFVAVARAKALFCSSRASKAARHHMRSLFCSCFPQGTTDGGISGFCNKAFYYLCCCNESKTILGFSYARPAWAAICVWLVVSITAQYLAMLGRPPMWRPTRPWVDLGEGWQPADGTCDRIGSLANDWLRNGSLATATKSSITATGTTTTTTNGYSRQREPSC